MNHQAFVDQVNAQWQRERTATGMTLGGLIEAMERACEQRVDSCGTDLIRPAQVKARYSDGREFWVRDIGSYRGYYCDLALEPGDDGNQCPCFDVLMMMLRGAVGWSFTGYKGGEFVMTEQTPVWVSPYGECSGQRIVRTELVDNGAPYNRTLVLHCEDEA